MSTSTIFIKRPLNYRQSFALLKEKYKDLSPALSLILWTISGIYAASRNSFNQNVSGLILSFLVSDLIVMTFASIVLCKGLIDKSIILLIPWMSLTAYSLYFTHYQGIVSTLTVLKRLKKISWLPWSSIVASVLLLIVRGTLTIRMFQLGVHLWFRKKLNELKAKEL
ncbi:uncharacterized protein LOC103313345 isoform X1 [Tribolium castaneum]|uniref:Uncharacterized protein n=1 Tax=Tribolium castaneum TaxID=7070 RepID=D2A553_TRICA|nr:PREDICTED: uncharacterized protein LOC103313345 [Tribolium castaneum]EFA05132.1 hypothetical protein TcasGA2_TC015247 [Tribolium castaneum]|eukprot:XP_008194593.1 PREDICTED: uncharacterized protein LOC103313345 [Tribolium castaneum]